MIQRRRFKEKKSSGLTFLFPHMIHKIRFFLTLSKDYVLQTQVCTQDTYGKSLVTSQIAMTYGYMPDTVRAAYKWHDLIYTQKPALILKRKIYFWLLSTLMLYNWFCNKNSLVMNSQELKSLYSWFNLCFKTSVAVWVLHFCLFVYEWFSSLLWSGCILLCQIIFSLNKVPSVLVHNHDHGCSHLRIICNFHHLTRLSVLNMLLNHCSTSSDITKNCVMLLHRNHLYVLLNRNSAAQ